MITRACITFLAVFSAINCRPLDDSSSRSESIELSKSKQLSISQVNAFATEASQWISAIGQQGKEVLRQPAPDCSDVQSTLTYVTSLAFLNNDFAGCLSHVKHCLTQTNLSNDSRAWLAWAGVNCLDNPSTSSDEFEKHAFYSQAVDFSKGSNELHALMTVSSAAWLIATPYANEAERIIDEHEGWTSEEKKLILATLELSRFGSHPWLDTDTAEYFIEQIKGAPYASVLEANWFGYLCYVFRNKDAIIFALDHQLLSTPIARALPWIWIRYIYSALYSANSSLYFKPGGNYSIDFSPVRKLYNAYLPYTHSQSFFSGEMNPYTYSELYNQFCIENLTQGEWNKRYKQLATNLSLRNHPTSQIKKQVEELIAELNQSGDSAPKADLLTLLANLYALEKNYELAIQYYWAAHNACKYYERAHWGLKSSNNLIQNASSYSYNETVRQMKKEIDGLVFPLSLNSYAPNFKALPDFAQDKIKYALKWFAPYLDDFVAQNSMLLIRYEFQLLSDLVSYESMRDRRILNYEADGRLWDDTRGAGGKIAAVDLSNILLSPTSKELIITHEVTHQLQSMLLGNRMQKCIKALFNDALRRNAAGEVVFTNNYAMENDMEYLAIGFETYAISPEMKSVIRTSFDRKWLATHDPNLHTLIQTITSKKIDDNTVTCPIVSGF